MVRFMSTALSVGVILSISAIPAQAQYGRYGGYGGGWGGWGGTAQGSIARGMGMFSRAAACTTWTRLRPDQ